MVLQVHHIFIVINSTKFFLTFFYDEPNNIEKTAISTYYYCRIINL